MKTREQIQEAVTGLPKPELDAFRCWFEEFDAEIWDRQIEQDVKAGKLDHLADRALKALAEGRCTEL